ncbi:Dipeptidyl aminopeptidase/acylaminoacyl peptidase [Streptomyces sp. 1222.5]|uniref:S9 family peptidase n=1 Tax=unclassified Streptomyces TaxID=2593676 RepID=UPI00089C1130|nr:MULTISPECIES: prolyl oligopeptidase family serine peptidase [unclassified Streptomyces]PKW00391.1 dipeptidyl aminopeptidase/acylaminoacyl peptidase [Streptomyces sp. 5112.2]SED86893.1 Dipeptidyl aminopeptidase/acylaminoacyl peptidase [Streptomyces sp. 1222.5]
MTAQRRTAPYGSWPSPIEAADVARGEALVEWVGFVGDEVWWTEARPEENGRSALVRHTPEGPVEALPGRWDVRTRVIEYGGRPWQALSDRAEDGIVFVHAADQRVYRYRPGRAPVPLSPAGAWPCELRYADFAVRGDEVWCLRERAADEDATDAVRHLVALPLDGSAADDPARVRELAATHHFMTGPRIEPGGDRVVWLGWDHPAMPWDTTEVMLARVRADGTVTRPTVAAGGSGREAVTQVEWAADGSGALYAVTDPDGWWNVHEILPAGGSRNLYPAAEEFGEALWRIGLRWLLPLRDGTLAVLHGVGERRLGVLTRDGRLTDLPGEATEWFFPATDGRRIAAVCAGPLMRRTVVLADPAEGRVTVLRPPADTSYDAWASRSYRRTYRGPDGEEVHAHVHPPHHPGFTGPNGELPPWIVFAHGGPTSRSHLVLNQEISYFTSRGIGVLDVQYGGSTGYGRAYRERLRESWGLTDVRDCATAARGLIADGLASADRVAIRGGSAGGWTAAASLGAEPGLYRAAGIYYPVLDPVGWRTRGTHDFESRYLDGLIGPWPQAKGRYEERSPVAAAARIRAPFVLLQGLADTVCPPAQAERLLALLGDSGPRHRYLTFEGEGHGFRRARAVVDSLHAELELYGRALGFTPAL